MRPAFRRFGSPDSAVRAFNYMWHYAYNLKGTLRDAGAADSILPLPRSAARKIIDECACSERTILTEYESKKLLKAYGIPTVETQIAATEDEALPGRQKIGYPVVLKLYSLTITHKTDVGGVVLNLRDADAVREAFNSIQSAVAEKVGAEHFQGVTVQPMAKLDGYELILGASSIRSSAPFCSLEPEVNL